VHNSIRDLSETIREQDLLRMFHDLPFVGMAVIAGDGSTVENVNDEFCRLLGYTHEEFSRQDWLALFEASDAKRRRELQRRLEHAQIERVLTETRMQRKDGGAVEVTLDMRCTRTADGSPTSSSRWPAT
jgi:PAS domain S-box-containing protein